MPRLLGYNPDLMSGSPRCLPRRPLHARDPQVKGVKSSSGLRSLQTILSTADPPRSSRDPEHPHTPKSRRPHSASTRQQTKQNTQERAQNVRPRCLESLDSLSPSLDFRSQAWTVNEHILKVFCRFLPEIIPGAPSTHRDRKCVTEEASLAEGLGHMPIGLNEFNQTALL